MSTVFWQSIRSSQKLRQTVRSFIDFYTTVVTQGSYFYFLTYILPRYGMDSLCVEITQYHDNWSQKPCNNWTVSRTELLQRFHRVSSDPWTWKTCKRSALVSIILILSNAMEFRYPIFNNLVDSQGLMSGKMLQHQAVIGVVFPDPMGRQLCFFMKWNTSKQTNNNLGLWLKYKRAIRLR